MADVCEKSGEIARALVHYKHFHESHETARGECAAKRVAVLKITHQVETAQRDADKALFIAKREGRNRTVVSTR